MCLHAGRWRFKVLVWTRNDQRVVSLYWSLFLCEVMKGSDAPKTCSRALGEAGQDHWCQETYWCLMLNAANWPFSLTASRPVFLSVFRFSITFDVMNILEQDRERTGSKIHLFLVRVGRIFVTHLNWECYRSRATRGHIRHQVKCCRHGSYWCPAESFLVPCVQLPTSASPPWAPSMHARIV